jgi:hypothetical protein
MIVTCLALIALTIFSAVAVRQGFFASPGAFLSWPMFTHVSFFRVDLTSDETGEPINPWQYMLHMDYGAGGLPALREFLTYLSEVHGVKASGDGVIADGKGYRRVEVRGSIVDCK